MLEQLRALARQVVARSVEGEALGRDLVVRSPVEALDLACAFARLVCPALSAATTAPSVASEGAAALFRFVADLPAWCREEVAHSQSTAPPPARAWNDPEAGAFASLGALVQDLWEHLLGPESRDDAAIEAAIIEEPSARALDFGCGAGHFAVALAARGTRVTCVEADPLKRAFLERRTSALGLGDLVAVAPCCPTSREASFDLALAINVLDHLERPEAVVAALAGCLRPGGRLVHVTEFPEDGWHQSDPAVVRAVVARLRHDFALVDRAPQGEVYLETLRRRAPDAPVPVGGPPRRLAAARWQPLPRSLNRYVLFARRFCARPCVVNGAGLTLFQHLDGTRDPEALAAACGLDVDEVRESIDALEAHGLLA